MSVNEGDIHRPSSKLVEEGVAKEKLAANSVLVVAREDERDLITTAEFLKARGTPIVIKMVPDGMKNELRLPYELSYRDRSDEEVKNRRLSSSLAKSLQEDFGDLGDAAVVVGGDSDIREVLMTIRSDAPYPIEYDREVERWDAETVKDVTDRLQPIVDQIRQRGLTPVVIQDNLSTDGTGDWWSFKGNEGEEIGRKVEGWGVTTEGEGYYSRGRVARDKKYSVILRDYMGLPVITRDDIRVEEKRRFEAGEVIPITYFEYKGDLKGVLGRLGVSAEQVVLLASTRFLSDLLAAARDSDQEEEFLKQTGFNRVKLVPISQDLIAKDDLIKRHPTTTLFNILDLDYSQERQRRANVLLKEVERSREAFRKIRKGESRVQT